MKRKIFLTPIFKILFSQPKFFRFNNLETIFQALFIDSYVKRTDMNIARTPSGTPQAGEFRRST